MLDGIIFIATLLPDVVSVPKYTYPKEPAPSKSATLKTNLSIFFMLI